MATQFHVFGPTTVSWGGSVAGYSDGQTLLAITTVAPTKPIPTDRFGGQPEDYIQCMGHAIVQLALGKWDDSIVDTMEAAMTAASTIGTLGQGGTVGLLRVADTGYKELIIAGTKPTSANGGRTFTFPRAFRSPFADVTLGEIGVDYARRVITMIAMANPDTSNNPYFTVASTT